MNAASSSLSKISIRTLPRTSRHGFLCVLAFSFWTVLLRLVLPFGDEPDFTVRAIELVDSKNHSPWSPYYWMINLLDGIKVESFCQPAASPATILGTIDSPTCTEPIEQVALRVGLTLVCSAPLLLIVVYRHATLKILAALGFRLKSTELSERLDALGTSLVIPGMIYYLGLLSHEQFSLSISLLISVVWGYWPLVIILATYTMALDIGNGAVVFAFLSIYIFINSTYRLLGSNGLTLLLIGAIFLFLVGGYDLLGYIQFLPILSDKAEAIYIKSLTADFLEKYPIIFRPIITYITAIFMTPTGIKAAPVQLMFAIAISIGIYRLRVNWQGKPRSSPAMATKQRQSRLLEIGGTKFLTMIAALTTIVLLSLMLPDYANAKYYMFLTPFIMLPFMAVFERRSRLLFINASCAVTLILLYLQYL